MWSHIIQKKKTRNKFQNIVELLGKVDIAKNKITQTISLNSLYAAFLYIFEVKARLC